MEGSGQKTKISLNCSLTVPPAPSQETSQAPDTPEILNTIVDITHGKVAEPSPNEQSKPSERPSQSVDNEYKRAYTSMAPQFSYQEQPTYPPDYESSPHMNDSLLQSLGAPYCDPSQLVREGLKMKVRKKLKDESSLKQELTSYLPVKTEREEITLEDEIRRHRRRERNKVAATKCRNKKKEKQTLLIAEGEVLEIQNVSLKEEISRLGGEKRRLSAILEQHKHTCLKRRKTTEATETNEVSDNDAPQNNFKIPQVPENPKENNPSKLSYVKEENDAVFINDLTEPKNDLTDVEAFNFNRSQDSGQVTENSYYDFYAPQADQFNRENQYESVPTDQNQSQFYNYKSCSFYDNSSPNYFLGNKFQHCFSSVGIFGNFDTDCVAL